MGDNTNKTPDRAEWNGHILLHPSHATELEARSAVHELGDGLAPDAAQDKAYSGYLASHLTAAAAHHLAAMRAASSVGDREVGLQHSISYGTVMRLLGHDPNLTPPSEIHALSMDPARTPSVAYRPHGMDAVAAELLRRARK